MRKSESIIRMEKLGMNCLDYFITEDEKEVAHYLAKHMDVPLSLRTEKGSDYMCPFYYQVNGRNLIDKAQKHLSEGYKLILAPSLDTRGCLGFGTVGLSDTEYDVIEFVLEEGKVRDLDTHRHRQTLFVGAACMVPALDKDYPRKAYILNKVYKEVRDICLPEAPCIVEWSYYNRPVGRLKKPIVFWEIRNY